MNKNEIYELLINNLNNFDYKIYNEYNLLKKSTITKYIKYNFLSFYNKLDDQQLDELFELLRHYICEKTIYVYKNTFISIRARWYAELWQRNIFKIEKQEKDWFLEDVCSYFTVRNKKISEIHEWYDIMKPIYDKIINNKEFIEKEFIINKEIY